jgi:hypothetical protein
MIDTLIAHAGDLAAGVMLWLLTVAVWMEVDVEDEPGGDE